MGLVGLTIFRISPIEIFVVIDWLIYNGVAGCSAGIIRIIWGFHRVEIGVVEINFYGIIKQDLHLSQIFLFPIRIGLLVLERNWCCWW